MQAIEGRVGLLPTDLLSSCGRLGVTLTADGDRLRYSGPREALTDDLLADIRRQKVALLVLLGSDDAPGAVPAVPPPIPADWRAQVDAWPEARWIEWREIVHTICEPRHATDETRAQAEEAAYRQLANPGPNRPAADPVAEPSPAADAAGMPVEPPF